MTEIAETRVLVGIITFFVGLAVGLVIDGASTSSTFMILVPAFASLSAAFAGAKYAFDLQNKRKEREERHQRIAAANRAIFALSRIYNRLDDFDNQLIKPLKTEHAAFLEMLPIIDVMRNDIVVDLDSISFLLETEHRNLLGEVAVVMTGYQSTIDAINLRSNIHAEQVQPVLERAGIHLGGEYRIGELKAALGERLYEIINGTTNAVIDSTHQTMKNAKKVSSRLSAAFREIFPGATIIQLAPPKGASVSPGSEPSAPP